MGDGSIPTTCTIPDRCQSQHLPFYHSTNAPHPHTHTLIPPKPAPPRPSSSHLAPSPEEPLVTYGKAHPELAGHDGYIPAFQMVLAHYSKHVWRRLMTTLSFEKIDIDGDGTLTREEIQRALEQVQGVQVAQVRT